MLLLGLYDQHGHLQLAGHTASYRLDLGPAGRLTARFTDGTLVVEPPGDEPVDCEIVADPAAMLLVSSGRLSQWPAIALGLIRPLWPDRVCKRGDHGARAFLST